MFFFPQANSVKAHMKRMSLKTKAVKTSRSYEDILPASRQRWWLQAVCYRLQGPAVLPKAVIFSGLCLALMIDDGSLVRWFVCHHVCLLLWPVMRAIESLLSQVWT